ncbi:MAG TPA: hypothetical protein PLF59_08280 [Cyclobacteriaceae bacterium]|nr:hypothetical protein [Cyclobacteriaceae bacterium]
MSTNFPRKKRQVKIFPSEKQESYALKKWADYHPICKKALLHIKNGGSLKSKIEGANFKRAGVKAGVSDYLLPYPVSPYHGLWIELKRREKSLCKVTDEQNDWLVLMASFGYAVCVAYGCLEAINKIKEYLNGSKIIFHV